MQRKVLLAVLWSCRVDLCGRNHKGQGDRQGNGRCSRGRKYLAHGTTLGAATNVNGEYTIVNVPVGVYTIRATFIGYAPVAVSTSGSTTI